MESTADIQVGDVAAPRAAVSIEITSTPVLSYALAHNRVPVVSRLAITNFGGPVRAATVRLSVRDAEGPIARTVELLADLDEGRTTVLTDLGLVMDPAAMLHVEEQRPGVIDVEVLAEGEVLGEGSRVVQVLAAQQWLATPLPLALEMLAAHVMPNHPAVTALVSEAADVLEERTGRGAIQGYADGPERVDEIVSAIADVLLRRGIRYSEPPISWSDLGQQVRSPGDVLTWRVGTPLDTVVVLAAALEQAGIRPLLWLADGHAFLGYWREERSAESAATTDAAPLVNLVDLGLIGLVETTLLTSTGEPGADLHRPAYTGWLAGELDRILGVTDVHRARKDGIFPLPARARDEDGVLQVVEYRPAHSLRRADGRARRPGTEQPARGAAAGAAVEERAARPQPAQPADQLHRALGPRADRARLGAGHPRELRPRRDADHPAAGRPAGRRPEGARGHHGPRAARGAAHRAAGRAPRGACRRHHRQLPAAAAQRRLQGEDGRRGDRRQQPLPRARQPGVGARRPPAAHRRSCSSPSSSRRWAAPARTG